MAADEHLNAAQSGRYTVVHRRSALSGSNYWRVGKTMPDVYGNERMHTVATMGTWAEPAREAHTTVPHPYSIGVGWHDYSTEELGLPQAPLFRHYPAMPHGQKVSTLFSTKEDRMMSMSVLGAAARMEEMQGGRLYPDTDLSMHSARMVEGLKRRGAVDPIEKSRVTNDITWREPTKWDPVEADERIVPPRELRAGRNYMADVLRRHRGKPDEPVARQVPGQQRLF